MSSRTPPVPVSPARRGRAAGWVVAIAAVYLVALWYLDRERDILSHLAALATPLGGCCLLVLASYVLRYQRWRQVLAAQHPHLPGWGRGLLAYLAGFAFTASPGKAGELLRIRYFGWQGVAPRTTLTTFIFERALDLAIITVLAVAAASLVPVFGTLALIILVVLIVIATLACWPPLATLGRRIIAHLPGAPVRRLAGFLIDGATALAPLLTWRLLSSSTALGTLAWLLTALAFAWLCHAAGFTLPVWLALGIYPLAMLIGALSFVPGGVGTTEAAIVVMLGATGVPTDSALAIAIGIRLASLWLAVLVGMLAMATLEADAQLQPAR